MLLKYQECAIIKIALNQLTNCQFTADSVELGFISGKYCITIFTSKGMWLTNITWLYFLLTVYVLTMLSPISLVSCHFSCNYLLQFPLFYLFIKHCYYNGNPREKLQDNNVLCGCHFPKPPWDLSLVLFYCSGFPKLYLAIKEVFI